MDRQIYHHPLLLFFLLVAAAHLCAEQIEWEFLIMATKPLLMPILALWFWLQTKEAGGKVRNFLLLGLLFSCGGDTLLMFVEHGPKEDQFFLVGLGSFLVAQLCYILALRAYPNFKSGLVSHHPWLMLLFLGYWYWVLETLMPGIPGEMLLPVAVYAFAIVVMAVMALNLSGRVAAEVFRGFFIGVMLFVISDTLIAFNKFGSPVPYARLAIMVTYILAQLLIAWNGVKMLTAPTIKNADQSTSG